MTGTSLHLWGRRPPRRPTADVSGFTDESDGRWECKGMAAFLLYTPLIRASESLPLPVTHRSVNSPLPALRCFSSHRGGSSSQIILLRALSSAEGDMQNSRCLITNPLNIRAFSQLKLPGTPHCLSSLPSGRVDDEGLPPHAGSRKETVL